MLGGVRPTHRHIPTALDLVGLLTDDALEELDKSKLLVHVLLLLPLAVHVLLYVQLEPIIAVFEVNQHLVQPRQAQSDVLF